jgi:hypothetical protein
VEDTHISVSNKNGEILKIKKLTSFSIEKITTGNNCSSGCTDEVSVKLYKGVKNIYIKNSANLAPLIQVPKLFSS